jgi:hypothetical protein
MAVLVANCPRCGSGNMTFDVSSTILTVQQYGWQRWYEDAVKAGYEAIAANASSAPGTATTGPS